MSEHTTPTADDRNDSECAPPDTPAVTPTALERFLYFEADLLDEWRLDEWLALFEDDGTYELPTTDKPDADVKDTLYMISDDLAVLRGRVNRLKSKSAWAENPRSRTRRFISNVTVVRQQGNEVDLAASFLVFRMNRGVVDTYIGRYYHVLTVADGSFKFRRRKAVLDLESLRPAGKVSIIL